MLLQVYQSQKPQATIWLAQRLKCDGWEVAFGVSAFVCLPSCLGWVFLRKSLPNGVTNFPDVVPSYPPHVSGFWLQVLFWHKGWNEQKRQKALQCSPAQETNPHCFVSLLLSHNEMWKVKSHLNPNTLVIEANKRSLLYTKALVQVYLAVLFPSQTCIIM